MRPVGFEPTISAGERPQTCVLDLDRAATGTGIYMCVCVCVYILRIICNFVPEQA